MAIAGFNQARCGGTGRTRSVHGRRALCLVAIVGVLVLGACGNETNPSSSRGPDGSGSKVAIQSFAFEPTALKVSRGARVTWTNQDDILHTVTSGRPQKQGVPGVSKSRPAQPDGLFDGRLDARGTRFTFVFDRAGTYEYFCSIHAGMEGEIVVN